MKKRKAGLRFKFAGLFVIFAVIIVMTVGSITYLNFQDAMLQKYTQEGMIVAKIAASYLDGETLLHYAETKEKDAEYEELDKALNNLKRQSGVVYLYVLMPVSGNDWIYIFDAVGDDAPDEYAELGEHNQWEDDFEQVEEVMETGQPSKMLDLAETDFGSLASVYVPISDRSGKPVAVVGVDFTLEEIAVFLVNSILDLLGIIIGLVFVCFLVLLILINHSIIKPIRVLKNGVQQIAEGNLGVQIPISGDDEIGDITEVFNRMSSNISEHMQEMAALNDGYYKFVPSIFFDILHRKNVCEIKLGDNKKVPLGILNVQINGFHEYAKKMESEEVFAYLNRIYQFCVPCIMENNGVVDAYYTDGFSAIFTELGKSTLDSAINICQKLNKKKKMKDTVLLQDVELAFGIAQGTPMVGIVGHEKRLSAVAMSEHISVAEYLKRTAPKYHARILTTGTNVSNIPDFEERYHARLIGYLYISTTGISEKIYDVYDGDEEEIYRIKDMTKDKFEAGVQLFVQKEFYAARRCFVDVLKVSQADYAAREYLYLCNEYYTMEDKTKAVTYIERF